MTSAAAGVPSGIAALDAEWLSAVLRADATVPATAAVTAVRAERIAVDTGFSSLLYRLHLTGTGGAPATMIAKLPGEPQARAGMELLGGYRREVAFYRYPGGRPPLSTPHVYAARIAVNSVDFVLLLEDLREWDNADQLGGLSVEQVRLCLEQLAGLHAWSLRVAHPPTLCTSFPSIDTPVTREVFPSLFVHGWQVFREHARIPVTAAMDRLAGRFAEYAAAALDALTERPMLLHGDIRADNLFFSGDRLKVVDFQLASIGAGAADVGYLISQGLPAASRAGRDEEFVREYVRMLADRGVGDYGFDEAWRHYRCAVVYLMYLPVIILVGWNDLPPRSRELCLTLIERALTTVEDVRALEVFA
jgi:hypothetical protein